MATTSSSFQTDSTTTDVEGGSFTWSLPVPPSWLVTTAIVTVVVMVIIGVPGNIIIVLVYQKKSNQQNSASLFIALLAVVDCITCAVLVPSLPFIMTGKAAVTYQKFWWSASTSVVVLSVWLLVAIATDHYRAICRPLSPHMSRGMAWIVVVIGCVVSMVLGAMLRFSNLPNVRAALGFDMFRWFSGMYLLLGLLLLAVLYANIFWFLIRRKRVGVVLHLAASQGTSNNTQMTGSVTKDTRITQISQRSSTDPALQGTSAGMSHVSSQMTTSTNAPEPSVISAYNSQRAPMSSENRNPVVANQPRIQKGVTKTAKMLAVVTILFVLSYTPTYILPSVLDDYNFAYTFTHFINHGANPFIYSFMNARFRADVQKLFRSRQVHPF